MHGTLEQLALSLIAQEGGASGGEALSSMIVPFFIVIAVLYFMVIRPANKERQTHQSMLGALKRGDEVLTSSGILGTIADMKDPFITLEISRNVKVRVLKSAIARKYDEPKKAETEKDDAKKDDAKKGEADGSKA